MYKQLGSLLALVILAALAQIPRPTATTPTHSPIPRQHAPRRHAGFRADRVVDNVTVSDSTNWSGYAVTGTSFTHALGSWTIPTATCSKTPNTYAAFWVGLDGWNSDTVEQTGTDSDCDGRTASYYAWYEFYPAASVLISSVTVHPGDHMSASVTFNSGSSFTLSITDETTGKSFTKTGTVSGADRSSAEWIAEAPCCTNAGGILPLADYGTVDFGEDFTDVSNTNSATDSTVSGLISAFGADVNEAIMVNGSTGAEESVPSSLSSDGSSFSATWESE